MWALYVLAALVLIGLLPVGIIASYGQNGTKISLSVAKIRIPLFPGRNKAKKRVKPEKKKAAPSQVKQSGGRLSEFLPLMRTLFSFLNSLRKRVRINDLQVKLILAGSDPCDLSVNYGRTWAAIGNIQPHLNRLFRIKRQNISVECDYFADETVVCCSLNASISVLRLLYLVVSYGIRLLRQYLDLKNQRKGGTVYEPETSTNA